MKIAGVTAFALLWCLTAPALAGTRVAQPSDGAARASAASPQFNDHPKAQPVANPEVRIEITGDKIIRSCCKPPDLLIWGAITNISSQPIDYVQLILSFQDETGKVVHTEDVYNHGAVTLGEDPEVARILNETPHFDPLAPGARDTFQLYIPLPAVPRYHSAKLNAAKIVRSSAAARAHQ